MFVKFCDAEEYFESSFHRNFQLLIGVMETPVILCSWRHTLRRVTLIMVQMTAQLN